MSTRTTLRTLASLAALALLGCGGAQAPEAQTAGAESGGGSATSPEEREQLLGPIRQQITAMFCARGSAFRACLQNISDEEKCAGFIEGSWHTCEDVFPADLNQGDAAFWEKKGEEVAGCISSAFLTAFPRVETEEEKAVCAAAQSK